jgi:hypothetical protein
LIVEELNESKELHDREKWEQYRTINSFRHFLLISRQRYQVEIYNRSQKQVLFYNQRFYGLEGLITSSPRPGFLTCP